MWLLVAVASVSPVISQALEIALAPIGGSATGRVGETLSIGIDLVIGEDEFVTIGLGLIGLSLARRTLPPRDGRSRG